MSGFLRAVVNIVITAIALYVTTMIVPGVSLTPRDSLWAFVGVAIVFIAVNMFIGPLLKIFSFPITLLTLGLFSLAIDAILFLIVGSISQGLGLGLNVSGFWAAFFGAIVMAIASWIVNAAFKAASLK